MVREKLKGSSSGNDVEKDVYGIEVCSTRWRGGSSSWGREKVVLK